MFLRPFALSVKNSEMVTICRLAMYRRRQIVTISMHEP